MNYGSLTHYVTQLHKELTKLHSQVYSSLRERSHTPESSQIEEQNPYISQAAPSKLLSFSLLLGLLMFVDSITNESGVECLKGLFTV
ncbi:hypothetical protein XELAEV_18032496mg [Xenopus laevis]|uniref:Uncharacterized protein n=1 Tax=Xenopus laevis TaxID=8355 RepID=A0A974HGL9_XENLA|nr:hypothetical protein XELAEV_18032496mg [Xenopus laevis]